MAPKAAPLLIMGPPLKYSLIGLLPLVFASLWLPARWQRLGITPSELHDALLAVDWLSVFFLVVLTTTFIARLLYIAWHRKELVPYLNPSMKDALHRDAEFIKQLLTFDKATLAYGLLQYRHRWSSSERFIALLVGDYRKLGLFPAWAALLISAATLFKGDSNPFLLFLWDLVAILVILYLMAFVASLLREKPQHVIQLLEFAIQHADQCNATPSDANH